MIDQDMQSSLATEPVSGSAARRRFLRTSGKAAVAAPAALLLLSAASRDVHAQPVPNGYEQDAAPGTAGN